MLWLDSSDEWPCVLFPTLTRSTGWHCRASCPSEGNANLSVGTLNLLSFSFSSLSFSPRVLLIVPLTNWAMTFSHTHGPSAAADPPVSAMYHDWLTQTKRLIPQMEKSSLSNRLDVKIPRVWQACRPDHIHRTYCPPAFGVHTVQQARATLMPSFPALAAPSLAPG